MNEIIITYIIISYPIFFYMVYRTWIELKTSFNKPEYQVVKDTLKEFWRRLQERKIKKKIFSPLTILMYIVLLIVFIPLSTPFLLVDKFIGLFKKKEKESEIIEEKNNLECLGG